MDAVDWVLAGAYAIIAGVVLTTLYAFLVTPGAC